MANTTTTVCSMCGDVGFADKLFKCMKCHFRFQHSYCSNYYDEKEPFKAYGICDWCLSSARSTDSQSKRPPPPPPPPPSGKGGDQVEESRSRGKGGSGSSSSSKSSGRRYKLLKDVLC